MPYTAYTRHYARNRQENATDQSRHQSAQDYLNAQRMKQQRQDQNAPYVKSLEDMAKNLDVCFSQIKRQILVTVKASHQAELAQLRQEKQRLLHAGKRDSKEMAKCEKSILKIEHAIEEEAEKTFKKRSKQFGWKAGAQNFHHQIVEHQYKRVVSQADVNQVQHELEAFKAQIEQQNSAPEAYTKSAKRCFR